MDRREAALILGLRETAAEERIKDAHRRIMIANHPDSGEPAQTAWSCGFEARRRSASQACVRRPAVARTHAPHPIL
jgi:DnaJ-class molecular chaperone